MKNRKSLILSIIAVITLLVLVVGATFAYFTVGGSISTSANVKVETSNQDILTFVVGDSINIETNQTLFSSGKGNASGSTKAKAILKTANEENELKANYYLYLNISKNEFSYTTEDDTAELLLKITDPSGNQVTSLDGLTYKTVTDGSNTSQSGFDITTKSGLITIANNKEIKAKPETTEEWKVEIIFVNLDKDQSGNAGKSLTAKLLIQKEKIPTLADVCTNGDNLASCIKTYANYESDATNIYIHNSSLTNGAGDNSYRYAGGDYVLTSKAINAGLNVLGASTSTSTNGVVNFYCNGSKSYVGNLCSSSNTHYYTLQYDSSNTQYETYSASLAKALTDGYLTKDNVKNFVCFGSDATPCPTANLYRIIGVFGGHVKLIKWDYATSAMLGTNGDFSQQDSYFFSGDQGESPSSHARYCWNNANRTATYRATNKYNVWSYSQLNTVNLNTNYITYLNNQNSKWANKIAETSWKVGGNNEVNIHTPPMNTVYQNEIVTPAESTTYSAKIGLMYVSDYGYAANPSAWTTTTDNYDSSSITSVNWMYMGLYDWTISRMSDILDGAFVVNISGNVCFSIVEHGYAVRPVFYLNSNVTYSSGDGTASNPIRVN